jgi:DNA-directed RNA polymerase subunit H (RpoH/RPB5)
MENYKPNEVYKNLLLMLKYRNIKLTSKVLDNVTIATKLNHNEYIIIEGERDSSDVRGGAKVKIVLIAPGSSYANKSADFRKLLNNFDSSEKLELIFISELPFTTYIVKQIIIEEKKSPNLFIEHYGYKIFLIETPKHVSVPKHTIATEQEIKDFCDYNYTSKDKFPKIRINDPQAIWLGLRLEMCVKVERLSETTTISHIYRYCVPAS